LQIFEQEIFLFGKLFLKRFSKSFPKQNALLLIFSNLHFSKTQKVFQNENPTNTFGQQIRKPGIRVAFPF